MVSPDSLEASHEVSGGQNGTIKPAAKKKKVINDVNVTLT